MSYQLLATSQKELIINEFIPTYYHLFKKDLLLEVRQQYSFYGILLYIGATIFVLFMAISEPEDQSLERSILGDPVIYLHQCRGEKFFAGKQRENALFLFHCLPVQFCACKIIVQLAADARHEFAQPVSVTLFFLAIPWKKSCLLSDWYYWEDGV